jgi:Cell wall-active antibiotics response 4TMS YvqF
MISKLFSTEPHAGERYKRSMHTSDILLADRRDHVISQLSAGFAGDRFEVDELERRLALAHSAESPLELDALVADLVPTSTALVPARALRVIMGSIERRGPWVVPQHLATRVVCGSVILDLREARLAPGVTTIDVHVTMGNVEVIVPPGMTVEIEASSMLGNIEQRTDPAPLGGGPVVRITGRVKLGNLEVGVLRIGESFKEARRRHRWEHRSRRMHRRMQRHAHRHGLPAPTEW